MNVTTTPAPRSTVVLEVDLPADRLQRQIDESVRRLGRRTRVAGFRPGRAPRVMLERALGVQRDRPEANPIYDDAKDQLFSSTRAEALRDGDVDPLTIPDPEWLRFEEGAGATYRVTVPVRPKVQLGDYRDFRFRPEIPEIDDDKVDRVVDELRDQHATLRTVEDRPIRTNDWVVVSFQGSRDGEPFEGGSSERFPLVVGAGRMIPGFEDQLVGMSTGEEKDFDVTFPDDYPDESLAGKPAHFHVGVREIREKLLPEADDGFAQELGVGEAFTSMDALRRDIRRRLEANAKDSARHEFADRIIEYATANATLEIPDVLIDQEVEVMHDELRLRIAEQGIPYEEWQRVTGRDDETLHREYREPAEHRVRVLMVLSEIADAEGIEVPEAEIEAEIAKARTRYTNNPRLISYFESDRGRRYLRTTMRRTQVVERLIDRWLDEHPDFGPLPHLEDDPALVRAAGGGGGGTSATGGGASENEAAETDPGPPESARAEPPVPVGRATVADSTGEAASGSAAGASAGEGEP